MSYLINRVLVVSSSEELVHQCIVPKLMSLLRRSNLLIWCECGGGGKMHVPSGLFFLNQTHSHVKVIESILI